MSLAGFLSVSALCVSVEQYFIVHSGLTVYTGHSIGKCVGADSDVTVHPFFFFFFYIRNT